MYPDRELSQLAADYTVFKASIDGNAPSKVDHVEISDDGSVVSYSTLIEEGKTKATEKRSGVESAPTKRRNGAHLNICKGC
jgi:flagellar hook protein FlgE